MMRTYQLFLIQRVARIRTNTLTYMKYLWWYLNSPYFIEHALENAIGSDLPHINGNDIALALITVPPIGE